MCNDLMSESVCCEKKKVANRHDRSEMICIQWRASGWFAQCIFNDTLRVTLNNNFKASKKSPLKEKFMVFKVSNKITFLPSSPLCWELFTSNNPLNSWQIYSHKFSSDVDYLYLPAFHEAKVDMKDIQFTSLAFYRRNLPLLTAARLFYFIEFLCKFSLSTLPLSALGLSTICNTFAWKSLHSHSQVSSISRLRMVDLL